TDSSPARVADNIPVGAGPAGIAVTPTAVWVANQLDLTVDRLDPVDGHRVGGATVGDGPSSIVATSSTVWVADEFDGTLTPIDPRTGQVRRKIAVGAVPAGLALAGSTLWIATRAFAGAGHRGGTLTVVGPDIARDDTIDPNDDYSADFVAAKLTVYDGLVAFRPAGGVAGLTLVPDLAMRIPRPTDDGTTYAFTLRRGIRYSNGAYVHASDFRRSVERTLALPAGNPGLFVSIVGARQCIDRPGQPCDLRKGIATDDSSGRVVFHLVGPDPQFLYNLTLFVYAIPPTAPRAKELTVPPPGTGPYTIVDYVKGKGYTLVRNRYFHQWSFAAQPDSYPEVIRWQRSLIGPAVDRVLKQAGDVVEIGSAAFGGQTGQVVDGLHTQHPAQLKSDPWLQTDMEQLNTRVPPFNNKLARQAVNYATDRNELVKRFGGPQLATPTCQMLPPNFPGYEPYCPFGMTDADGKYAGPDMATAKKLVARSGTYGAAVTVDVTTNPMYGPYTNYFAELLRKLGYRVTVRKMNDKFGFYKDSRNKMQISWANGWIADYPAPDNFYGPLFSCAGFAPANPNNNNVSEFCDHGIDALAARARALDTTNPTAAKALWRKVDQRVTNASPAIFTLTGHMNTLISKRVGNYSRTLLGVLLVDQMWVQ
ncbi:MAG TPA: ABC transporter substrate-binding protein, partial [Mycobacterium sp.]|nr:ABC transporter substrate-binding protein [Mycobacterium sp.]